jgi:hypothetical protein
MPKMGIRKNAGKTAILVTNDGWREVWKRRENRLSTGKTGQAVMVFERHKPV